MKVSSGILNVFNKSLSWKAEKKEFNITTNSESRLFIQGWRKRGPTWNIVYIMTVSGRFPENSEILKTLRPHLFTCSSSFKRRKRNKIMKLHVGCQVHLCVQIETRQDKPSLTHPRSPSWRRNGGCWSWWGWRSVEAFSPHWSETWAYSSSPSPSVSGGTASPPHAACLGWRNEAYFIELMALMDSGSEKADRG